MRAVVAPEDRVVAVGSCPAQTSDGRIVPTPIERTMVVGRAIPARRVITVSRRRRIAVANAFDQLVVAAAPPHPDEDAGDEETRGDTEQSDDE